MEVIVGKSAGFCGGVFNSVSKTEKLLDENDKLYCLGELVHNQQVVDKLSGKGLKIIDSINNIHNEKVIVRAHGIPQEVYDTAKKNNIELIDLTCPKVLKIHDIAKEYVKDNYFIVLIAKKVHPEAIGTISYCGNDSYVLENEDGINDLVNVFNKSGKDKIAIIAQTTYSVSGFDKLVDLIKSSINVDIVVDNTICAATSIRQKECAELSKEVDTMIIIGGKNSSNTKKLYEVAQTNCDNTIIVETVDDLVIDDLKYSKKVGVMAGASTPKESIDDVVNFLKGR